MARLLAVSDIHGNVRAVRQLRARESNNFDAVIVAGDLGSDEASEVFGVLQSFACPVLYVYGNWDHGLEFDRSFGPGCVHLHGRPFEIERISFLGFSGLPTHWGRNPIAESIHNDVAERHRTILDAYSECEAALALAEIEIEAEHAMQLARVTSRTNERRKAEYRTKVAELNHRRDGRISGASRKAERLSDSKQYRAYVEDLRSKRPEIAARNRQALVDAVRTSDADPKGTAVVTHERLTRTTKDLPEIPLFLFGHRHGFRDIPFVGSRFVNVSVLDNPITVVPRSGAKRTDPDSYRNLNNGNYVVIEGSNLREMRVRCVKFDPNLENWDVQPFVIIGEEWADA